MKEYAFNLQLAGCNYTLNDLFTQILCGLDNEYTHVVVTVNEMEDLTWIEFQTYLLSFESRLDRLNSLQNLTLNSVTTNLITSNARSVSKIGNNSKNENKGNWRGSYRGGIG